MWKLNWTAGNLIRHPSIHYPSLFHGAPVSWGRCVDTCLFSFNDSATLSSLAVGQMPNGILLVQHGGR